jgi:DNA repair ATPase RecN
VTDILLILIGVLLAATVGAAFEYYRQIRKSQKEYEKAKEIVDDIVLSFNRELKQEAERLELVAYKVESNSSKIDSALKKVENFERNLAPLEGKVSAISENSEKLSTMVKDIDKKMRDMEASQEDLKTKVLGFEEQVRQFSVLPEVKGEAVIPIRRDKAIAPLTETELTVLEMLSTQGPMTAPEIKERVKLSREHTARLMKKLYEEGYLERETNKIPFKYRVKKEMGKLLKKPEDQQT